MLGTPSHHPPRNRHKQATPPPPPPLASTKARPAASSPSRLAAAAVAAENRAADELPSVFALSRVHVRGVWDTYLLNRTHRVLEFRDPHSIDLPDRSPAVFRRVVLPFYDVASNAELDFQLWLATAGDRRTKGGPAVRKACRCAQGWGEQRRRRRRRRGTGRADAGQDHARPRGLRHRARGNQRCAACSRRYKGLSERRRKRWRRPADGSA
ncbi:hypothetical protein DFJ73DRAFT_117854 [Zopfochytrium polystomum]|nr:hypothetical protein DFJ73DRAFT_117854 [Zopfochytrium polystomum]